MKCPNCTNVDLVLRRRQWLRVDVCPSCNGSWLQHIDMERLLQLAQHPRHSPDTVRDADYAEPFYRRSRHDEYRQDRHRHRDNSRDRYDDGDLSNPRPHQRQASFDNIKEFVD